MSIAPPDLPTGTVTFLMTDIEGSTELVRRLGDRWPTVVGEHRRLLREAVDAAAGHEVDSRGEEAFFAFRRAQDAIAAAAAAQRALSAHTWPESAAVRVRMGIHTGEPALGDDGGYLGIDVHRAARICAAGHGGQVLVSSTTRALVADSEVRFVDLGELQLKGFARAARIYQLAAPGLGERFAPLRRAARAPFAGGERSLATAAQGLVSRGRPRMPRVLRSQPSTARRLADISWHVRRGQRDVPEAERPEALEVARALLVLSRTTDDTDRRLARLDRRALERKLAETHRLATNSRYAQTQAEDLARQSALVDDLTTARAAVDERIDELAGQADVIDLSDGAMFRAELDSLNRELEEALARVATEVGHHAERLHRTRHRGIYRQGDLWAIPYVDSLGVDRVRRFDNLDEARAFRRQLRAVDWANRVVFNDPGSAPDGVGTGGDGD
jgi:class 3 adenylate cyclase